jgi:hypothetical protein
MRQSVRGVRNLDGMPDGHSASLRQCVRGRTAPVPHGQLGGHGGRTPTMLTLLEAAVPCGSSGLGRARLRAARVAMSRWLPQGPPVSTLVAACGRWSDSRPSLRSPQTPAWPATPACPRVPDTAVRRAVVPEAADSQVRRSLRLVIYFSFKAGPAGGLRRRPVQRQTCGSAEWALERGGSRVAGRWDRLGHTLMAITRWSALPSVEDRCSCGRCGSPGLGTSGP